MFNSCCGLSVSFARGCIVQNLCEHFVLFRCFIFCMSDHRKYWWLISCALFISSMFCFTSPSMWTSYFLHLLGTLIRIFFLHFFFPTHPSEWLLSALGLFPPSVWPTLPSTLRQVFLKRKKGVCCVFMILYVVNEKKVTKNKLFYVVLGKYESSRMLMKAGYISASLVTSLPFIKLHIYVSLPIKRACRKYKGPYSVSNVCTAFMYINATLIHFYILKSVKEQSVKHQEYVKNIWKYIYI